MSNPDVLLDLVRSPLEDEINRMLTTVTFGDFTATEVVVLVAALRPAYERRQARTKKPAISLRLAGT